MTSVPPLSLGGIASQLPPTPRSKDLHIDFKKIKSEGISHHFPILAGLYIEGKEGENPSVQALAEEMRREGHAVSTFPIEWRGKSQAELSSALSPMLFHYRLQALLLCERTRRRVVENEQLSVWSNLHVAFQRTTPLKHKVMAHWTKTVLERQLNEIDNQHESDVRLRRLQSSAANSESSFRTAEGPQNADGKDDARRYSQQGTVGKPQQQHQWRNTAPPMLPSRRGSLPSHGSNANPQRGDTNGEGVPDSAALTANPSQQQRQRQRPRVLADADDTVASFEKTLTMLLENPQRGGRGRGNRRTPPPPAPLAPLNLPNARQADAASRSGDALAAVFQSVMQPQTRDRANE